MLDYPQLIREVIAGNGRARPKIQKTHSQLEINYFQLVQDGLVLNFTPGDDLNPNTLSAARIDTEPDENELAHVVAGIRSAVGGLTLLIAHRVLSRDENPYRYIDIFWKA